MSDGQEKNPHKHKKEGRKTKVKKSDAVAQNKGESSNAGTQQITKDKINDDDIDESTSGKIDIHTLNYFKRVEKLLTDDTFDDKESKELFLNNVLGQVGMGLRTCQLARHRLTSKVLECLIEMSNTQQYSELFESLLEDTLTIARDRFGSHVLQKVVCVILKHLAIDDKALSEKIESLFFKFVTEMKKNLPSLIRDMYSSHVLSSLVQALAGVRIPDNVTRSRNSQASRGKIFRGDMSKKTGPNNFGIVVEKSDHSVPDSFKKKLHKLTKRIIKDYNFGELLCHKNGSIVIQILLLALKETEERSCERVCTMILEKSKIIQQSSEGGQDDSSKRVPILFADEVGSHVMEKIFYVASKELYQVIYTKCFKNNLLQYSLHPLANYILQHMLKNIPTVEIASAALEELSPFTEDILASGNMGVVIRLAELAQRFNSNQKCLLNAITKAVHLPSGKNERKSIIKLLLALSTYDVMFEKQNTDENEDSPHENNNEASTEPKSGVLTKDIMNYHGACLSKILFHFEDPKLLIKSLLSLANELLFLIRHEYGSFVIEEFITSKSVAKHYKTKFLLLIKDDIVAMAKDKFGSHVVDKLWSNGTEDERRIIKEELFKFRGQLKGNMYGRIVLRNCGIESFQIPNTGKRNTAKGEDQLGRSETPKPVRGSSDAAQKQKGKRRAGDSSGNEIEEVIGKKKTKKDLSSYNEELLRLGVGMDEDEWKDSKVKDKNDFGKESSREIDELFAKGSKKKKG